MAKSRAVCECTGCGQFFMTEVTFNLHRIGSFGKPTRLSNGVTTYSNHERRCMSQEEMYLEGLSLNDRGIWTASIIDDTEEVSEEKERMKV
jgi:hypothetical protein